MQSITETHRQIITDFNSIKSSINNLGGTLDDDPTSAYSTTLDNFKDTLDLFDRRLNGEYITWN